MEGHELPVLLLGLSSIQSAYLRNAEAAVGMMPPKQAERVTTYDTGFMGEYHLTFTACRCADAGLSVERTVELLDYVKARMYGGVILSPASIKKFIPMAKKNDKRPANLSISMPRAMAVLTYSLPSARV